MLQRHLGICVQAPHMLAMFDTHGAYVTFLRLLYGYLHRLDGYDLAETPSSINQRCRRSFPDDRYLCAGSNCAHFDAFDIVRYSDDAVAVVSSEVGFDKKVCYKFCLISWSTCCSEDICSKSSKFISIYSRHTVHRCIIG